MSTNPYQGQNPEPADPYGGYGGYSGSPASPQQTSSDQNYQYGQYSPPAGDDADYQYGQQGYASGQQQQQQQQQFSYNTYQPPLSATQTGSAAADAMEPGARNKAIISYVLGPFSGLVLFFLERRNRFVRFSAAQSFVYFGALVVVYVVLRLIGAIPVLGTIILGPIVGLLTFIILAIGILTWLFLMYQAHRGKTIRLPFFAGYADAMIQRFSKK